MVLQNKATGVRDGIVGREAMRRVLVMDAMSITAPPIN
jgi:hypothetical protein